jgi:hypothetical protein
MGEGAVMVAVVARRKLVPRPNRCSTLSQTHLAGDRGVL